MKLVLLAIARVGSVDRGRLLDLSGISPHLLDHTLDKLRASGHLDRIEEVLRG